MRSISERLESGVAPGVEPSPFLKWVGGKNRLLAQYEALLPEEFEGYHEPFVGGGALYFHLRPERAVLSDINGRLVDTWRAIRDDLPALVGLLDEHRRRHDRSYYYQARQRFNAGRMGRVERAALMIYLNKTCFNGLYRENSRGEFNVPVGSYRDPSVYDIENLISVSVQLQGTEIRVSSFDGVLERARPGDLVYFDPPYVPLSATSSFTGYVAGGFDEKLQHRLAQVFATLAQRGCMVMLSNSDCAFVRELYRGWRIFDIRASRSINRNGNGRGAVGEVLVRSW